MASEMCSYVHHLSGYSQSDLQLMVYAKSSESESTGVPPNKAGMFANWLNVTIVI